MTLTHGEVTLRPLRAADQKAWREVRARNDAWLRQWDATVPPQAPGRAPTFRTLARRLDRMARDGLAMPFVLEVDGEFAGQVTVNNIVRGSAQWASVGYWIDRRHAGRGLMPLAVAMVVDHCFFEAHLHRVEVAIRPENRNSLRVVEKLGMTEFGLAPRYLHIDGDWRDHRLFAITVEECRGSLVHQLLKSQ